MTEPRMKRLKPEQILKLPNKELIDYWREFHPKETHFGLWILSLEKEVEEKNNE